MIKLIAFDLGETLINYNGLSLNWADHYERSLKSAFSSMDIDYSETAIQDASKILFKYNTRINPRLEEVTAGQIFAEIAETLNIDKIRSKQFIKQFFAYFQKDSVPEETAFDLLRHLKEKGIKTAVLTDVPYGMPKEFVEKDLSMISDFIDLIITSEEAGFRKPSAAGLKIILRQFQAEASQTIYIGNEQKDIETANNLGVCSILLRPEGNIPEWGQKRTIRKLIELKLFIN